MGWDGMAGCDGMRGEVKGGCGWAGDGTRSNKQAQVPSTERQGKRKEQGPSLLPQVSGGIA